jgi:hypothetical protein
VDSGNVDVADFLIIRNRCDAATKYTNWVGDGLRAYLESKGHAVTDLSDADASPDKVRDWLAYDNRKTMKAIIALDHGSLDAFWGEENGDIAPVIDLANVEDLTKGLHVYTLACATNGAGGLGETAVSKGCYSWLGYTEPIYAQKSRTFKECIWSYIEAMAEGKTIEQCERVLRDAYAARTSRSFIFQHNLDRLLLRKSANNMTINSHNRLAKEIPLVVALWEHTGYQGRRRLIVDDTPRLDLQDFNDQVSAVGVHPGPDYEAWKAAHGQAEPTVGLYEHVNYDGAALILTAGGYPNIHRLYNFGDVVSSVRINPTPPSVVKIAPIPLIVELYEDINFGGTRAVIVEDVPDIPRYLGPEFNDVVSSVRVRTGPDYSPGKQAQLFRDVDYSGNSTRLGPGDYPNIGTSHGFNDIVSSIRVR